MPCFNNTKGMNIFEMNCLWNVSELVGFLRIQRVSRKQWWCSPVLLKMKDRSDERSVSDKLLMHLSSGVSRTSPNI